MAWTERENWLRNVTFQGHQWIPQYTYISAAYWQEARDDLERICLRHPTLFPDLREGQIDYDAGVRAEADRHRVDAWGCEWVYDIDGLDGLVIGHPLADWAALETWRPPAAPTFTPAMAAELSAERARGRVTSYSTEHGFLFMRLFYLRGFDEFMLAGVQIGCFALLADLVSKKR